MTIVAASLRTSGAEIYGAAKGLDPAVMAETHGQIVRWAQAGGGAATASPPGS